VGRGVGFWVGVGGGVLDYCSSTPSLCLEDGRWDGVAGTYRRVEDFVLDRCGRLQALHVVL
jgi:hypothetical protein